MCFYVFDGSSPRLWTVEWLKTFLKEEVLPVSGRKSELVERAADFLEMKALETELVLQCSGTSA